ncbi:5-oxoprolinase subunit PxpB [Pseudobacillus sp. 179-B 2D1 NHS]|uniref:5-oxoprolinase subunit PxpB n=1 Tax=Pseudobacillus sp. 179-B 2D1 NHS TaxID=3374292 RepID=UPI003879ECA5
MSHPEFLNQENIMIKPLGDTAMTVQFGTDITPDLHQKVKALSSKLNNHSFPGFIEYIPAFASVTIFYDPLVVYQAFGGSPSQAVYSILADMVSHLQKEDAPTRQIREIPVCYGGTLGPDLQYVADYHQLSVDEVISIHSSVEYLVYMIGFAPGFPYLGSLSKKIATPRRSSPRVSIPAGSVGIAGSQTGVYPLETPGGWQLIGRTFLPLFTPNSEPPTFLQAGDIVKFIPISEKEYMLRRRFYELESN